MTEVGDRVARRLASATVGGAAREGHGDQGFHGVCGADGGFFGGALPCY